MIKEINNTESTFYYWRLALSNLYEGYKKYRPKTTFLIITVFLFFVFVNIVCYWFAMMTAFPDLIFNAQTGYHYFKVQFPVGIMAGLFDTISFFATLIIIKHALQSNTNFKFIAHLSVDFFIGMLSSLYVLLIFHLSPWIITLMEGVTEELLQRNVLMQERVISALNSPFDNWRNIYFGLIMGASAMLPTFIHLYMAINFLIFRKIEDKKLHQ